MSEKIICSISHITKEFPGVKALDDVNFDVREGEIHAIVGENGAGKSTLMNILSGVYKPTSGKIIFDGKEVSPNAPVEASALGIAMIHQELSLSHTLSVAENIFQARQPKSKLGLIDKKKLYADSRRLLDEVGLKDMDPSTLVRDINASQQQQVEIAKALSQNTRFLIMDEPTSALTPNETHILFDIMRNLKAKGITMLYISHKLDEIMNVSDRITVLRDGHYIDTLVTAETQISDMISLMVGREYSGGYTRAHYMNEEDYAKAKPIMEVKNLNVKNKVHDVSFTLYEGEVLGLAGLVGAGRTEVLQAVFGADPRISGQVIVDGKELTRNNTREAIKHGMGLVPEGRKTQGLYLKFSVEQNMTIVWLNALLKKLGLIRAGKERENAQTYRERLRVKTPSLEQQIVNLSGGNQQKTIIARWLMNEPKILFLDEPTQGIDVGAKNEIYEIIDQLAASGVSVVMVSSEMQENISLCDRIVVLYEGHITGTICHDQANEKSVMALMSGQKQ
ncbi:MAG: sugar ABC transporter ATP-binding protein [Eubacteriales bacterium]|nr:sugar ABC transporter ATP-binding protein [Eubacteriales bacterium]